MAALGAGLSTYNSCNKAGSIPHFTKHLSCHPNDYVALTWRGRAYSIIGKTAEAKADFQKAYLVSSGPQKCLSQVRIEEIDGNIKQVFAILQNTKRQYPNCAEAWDELGSHCGAEPDLALECLRKANRLAIDNSETGEPWFPWCNNTIGDILYQRQQVHEARKHYETAVQSSNTLTVGHLGLSRCDIINNNIAKAGSSFLTAKSLNPALVAWETFDDFSREVQTEHFFSASMASLASALSNLNVIFDPAQTTMMREATTDDGDKGEPRIASPNFLHQQHREQKEIDSARLQLSSGATPRRTRGTRAQSSKSGNGNLPGGSGSGSGGSGDESDSDDKKDLTPEEREAAWKKIKDEAPRRMKYCSMRFYQSKCKNYWYSKIEPSLRHGSKTKSFLKKYTDKGKTIELIVSIDENMEEMVGKHESGKYDVIKKSDMNGF